MIIGGPASQLLAGRVAAILGQELALCDYKTFPDGESYTQVVTPLDEEIVIIQSTPTDQDLVFLLQLLDVCQGKKVSLVIPYFGYARQDKIFKPGEPMTARAVATALNPFLKERTGLSGEYPCPVHHVAFPVRSQEPGCHSPSGREDRQHEAARPRGHLPG